MVNIEEEYPYHLTIEFLTCDDVDSSFRRYLKWGKYFIKNMDDNVIRLINNELISLETNLLSDDDITILKIPIDKSFLPFFHRFTRKLKDKYLIIDISLRTHTNTFDFENKPYFSLNNTFHITMILKKYEKINNSMIKEHIYEIKKYKKTNNPSEIIILNELEESVGFKLKEDSFINREILNEKIIKLSLETEHKIAGFCLTIDDFIDEIHDSMAFIYCVIICNPFSYTYIPPETSLIERERILREFKADQQRNEQLLYPWKTLDYSFPEFDFKPDKYSSYEFQLFSENKRIQFLRKMKVKWDNWNSTKFAMKLPTELTHYISEILMGKF